MSVTSHSTPVSACPRCGYRMDRALGGGCRGKHAPEPGDLTICLKCAAVLRFDPEMRLRKQTPEEVFQVKLDWDLNCAVERARARIRRAARRRTQLN